MIQEPPIFETAFSASLERLVSWRRDQRHFKIAPVAEEQIEYLLRVAQSAPSVGNSQPWRFVRIRSNTIRAWLADHADDEIARAGAVIADPSRREAYGRLKLHGLREAPEIMTVFCDETTSAGHGLGVATMPEAFAYSVVLAIHTLWLTARALGLAVGWVSVVDPVEVATYLKVPTAWRLIAVLCVGWPNEAANIPELERRGWQARLDWRTNVSER